MSDQQQARGGRYQRSASGMVGAMVATLLVVLAFVAFRAVTRDDLEIEPEPVAYLSVVERAEAEGHQVVHPPELPVGWIATSAELVPGDGVEWGMGVLTGDGDYVGLRQEPASPADLVETYVDEAATEEGQVRIEGPLGGTWQEWSDEGGDLGYTTEVRGDTVLVYGSASAEELRAFAGLLTR